MNKAEEDALVESCDPDDLAAREAELAEWKRRAEEAEGRLFALGAMDEPPCFKCGYNGPGYYQPDKHPCSALHHAAIAAKGEA